MSFISFKFAILLISCLLLYYITPQRLRWIVLLLGSIAFYCFGGVISAAYVVTEGIIAFAAGQRIASFDSSNKRKRRLFLYSSVFVLLGVLAFFKLVSFMDLSGKFLIVPIGISYYTFSVIGYLADVYWKKDVPEKNLFKFLLFILYFPKVIQGPISRRKFLAPQLESGKTADYKSFCFGLQLILWGLFKKLVIAQRASVVVSTVYNDLGKYYKSGSILFLAMVLAVVDLYADFSGYMDIAQGVSALFGIEIESNFKRPFFSKSAAEFWRRWHITLGTWFKDYVYMPIVVWPPLIKFSGKIRKRLGKRAGKAVMNIVPLAVVWFFIGLWHGTGINYIVWGAYWGTLIILSDIFNPELKKFTSFLHINTEAPTWNLFRMLRTCMLYCIGKMISGQNNLHNVKVIFIGLVKHPNLSRLADGTIFKLGLEKHDLFILALAIAILWLVGYMQEKQSVREWIASWNCIPRWFFYGFSIILVVMLGVYGAGYDTGSFAYQFF